jgi:hypothetical protein
MNYLEKITEIASIRNSKISNIFKKLIPMNRPKVPPISNIKVKSVILGICVIITVEKSEIEK